MSLWLKYENCWTNKRISTELCSNSRRKASKLVQIIVDSSNRRIDDLSKQVYDFKVSLEMTQKDFDDFKVSCKTRTKNRTETKSDLDTICKSFNLHLRQIRISGSPLQALQYCYRWHYRVWKRKGVWIWRKNEKIIQWKTASGSSQNWVGLGSQNR